MSKGAALSKQFQETNYYILIFTFYKYRKRNMFNYKLRKVIISKNVHQIFLKTNMILPL